MNVSPETLHLTGQWVEKAEEDLTTAEHTLLIREGCPLSTVCFHAQQCAEKYLKALLTYHSIATPRSHDLLELLPMVPADLGLGGHLNDLASINRFSFESRYPGDWDPIERRDAEEAVAIAKRPREESRPRQFHPVQLARMK